MGSAETGLALKLTNRQAADFELLANGGFAPLIRAGAWGLRRLRRWMK